MKIQLYLENETDVSFDFSIEEVAQSVMEKVLEVEQCPYDVEINVLLTDNEGIREYNRQMREIDSPTDVLSFPNLDFVQPAVFQIEAGTEADYTNPETGYIVFGDIILSVDKIISQAMEYGHSKKREYAFLIAHSMYHLCGYDHMTEEEASLMEGRQEHILSLLQITRDLE
jgi:probable rRNA maturation factor